MSRHYATHREEKGGVLAFLGKALRYTFYAVVIYHAFLLYYAPDKLGDLLAPVRHAAEPKPASDESIREYIETGERFKAKLRRMCEDPIFECDPADYQ